MTDNQAHVLRLLASAVLDTPPPEPLDAPDWPAVSDEARAHRIEAVVYYTVLRLPQGQCPPAELLDRWKKQTVSSEMAQLLRELALDAVLQAARAAGLPLLLVKGRVLAALYPHPLARIASDADLLVPAGRRDEAAQLLEELGFVLDTQASSPHEEVFAGQNLVLELHTSLWEEQDGPIHDTLKSLGVDDQAAWVLNEGNTPACYTLPPTQDLFYQIYHMVKHLFVCGAGIRYLADLSLFDLAHGDTIDWPLFWDWTRQVGYVGITSHVFSLCRTWFGAFGTALAAQPGPAPDAAVTQGLLDDMLAGGHGGRRTAARYKAGRLMRPYYENRNRPVKEKGRLGLVMELLFPDAETLRNQRTTSHGYSRFLPLAWCQWWLWLLGRQQRSGKAGPSHEENCTLARRVETAQERLDLMRQLDLVQKK